MAVLTQGQPVGALDSHFIDSVEPQQSPIVDPNDPYAQLIDRRRQRRIENESRIDALKDDKLGGIGRLLTATAMGYRGQDPSAAFSDFNQRVGALQQQNAQLNAGIEDINLQRVMTDQQDGGPRFGTINPRDYTPESLARYQQTGDFRDLQRYANQQFKMIRGEDGRERLHVLNPASGQYEPAQGSIVDGEVQPRDNQPSTVTSRTPEEEAEAVAGAKARGKAAFQVPEGYRRTDDGMEPIPGSPADQQIKNVAKQRAESMEITQRAARTVVDDTQRALDVLDRSGSWAAGAGSYLSGLPGTPARSLQKHIDSIKGNIGIDSLLSIKRSGAGLGAIPQGQLEMLASLMGNLDTAQSPSELAYNLRRIEEIYAGIVEQTGGDPKQIPENRERLQDGLEPATGEDLSGFKIISVE